jgi:hypothetical protein
MKMYTLYSKYFQKSKVFLYPLLGIKRGSNVVPEETFVSWNENLTSEDMKLICLYKRGKDQEFEYFEKLLLKHPRLCDYVNINEEEVLFTFDFSDLGDDWDCFINGKYSMMSMSVKRKIIDFFDKTSGNYIYIESFLYPHKWFDKYSELLDTDVEILKRVGELCDKPNLEKEKLTIKVVDLEKLNILN